MDPLLVDLAIALGLGLLVGLEREWAAKEVAGARTFPLITIGGAICAALAETHGSWILPTGLLAVTLLLLGGSISVLRHQPPAVGITTEVAAFVMFLVGAAVVDGQRMPAVVTTGAVTLLLHWKRQLKGWVQHVGESDLRALGRFVLIALVILPALPDRSYGPYDVLNPRQIWLMVVLIVGVSLAAYVAYRAFGTRGGTLLAGALGGLISSTAATVGYAQETRRGRFTPSAALVLVLIASAVVNLRVLFEVTMVAPRLLPGIAPPVLALSGVQVLLFTVAWTLGRKGLGRLDLREAPSDLRGPILFAVLYAAVLFAIAAVHERQQGDGRGLYAVAALSGLTDMDAITLSTARLCEEGRLSVAVAWRLILTATMANMVFKTAIVAVVGSTQLFWRLTPYLLVLIACGLALIRYWP